MQSIDRTSSYDKSTKPVSYFFYDGQPASVMNLQSGFSHSLLSDLNIKKSTVHNFLKTECNLSLNRVTIRPVSRDDTTKIAARLDWVKHWTMTDMNYLRNCVLVGESAFNINMQPSGGWYEKGTAAIVTTPSTIIRYQVTFLLGLLCLWNFETHKRNGRNASRSATVTTK